MTPELKSKILVLIDAELSYLSTQGPGHFSQLFNLEQLRDDFCDQICRDEVALEEFETQLDAIEWAGDDVVADLQRQNPRFDAEKLMSVQSWRAAWRFRVEDVKEIV